MASATPLVPLCGRSALSALTPSLLAARLPFLVVAF